ncbi:MAG TPA: U32 family peptidase [Firmicutes bacterium]|jgi:putative protease|nr:U32 family peptidase [Bacillota bacterium]
MNGPELLVPAGNLEKLRTAVLYGADAVYTGVEGLSLRARQAEMTIAELAEGVRLAHRRKVKVYAALNIFARNRDLALIRQRVGQLAEIGVDAVLVSDVGVLQTVRQVAPRLPVHLSTQANTTNAEAVRFWHGLGVSRIVLARELSLAEIGQIATAVPEIELELFVHGAMCLAYSGRCLLSAYLTGRSANRGECTHPCRWEYSLTERTRPEEPLVLTGDDRYSYLLSAKDLRMIEYLPEILKAGVTSLKIEGRMKSVYYLAVVTRTYRWALDAAALDPAGYRCDPAWLAELEKVSHRGYTTGFYLQSEGEKFAGVNLKESYRKTHGLVGTVLEYRPTEGRVLVELRNQLVAGDETELLLPDATLLLDSQAMTNEAGEPLAEGHNRYRVYFPVDREVPTGAVLRRRLARV